MIYYGSPLAAAKAAVTLPGVQQKIKAVIHIIITCLNIKIDFTTDFIIH